eukprot:Rmarinus@m.20113
MAYVIESRKFEGPLHRLPMKGVLTKGEHRRVTLDRLLEADYAAVRAMLNDAIEEGNSYPQRETLDEAGFRAYYVSHDAFVLKDDSCEGAEAVVGAFYIKPNFPGRCSHFCNGGFLVSRRYRGEGAGRFLAECYLKLAKDLGYRASFFNLVFETNPASLGLWRKMGFTELAIIPGVCETHNGQYVNGHQFFFDLTKVDD